MFLTPNESLAFDLCSEVERFVKTEAYALSYHTMLAWIAHSVVRAGWSPNEDRAQLISITMSQIVATISRSYKEPIDCVQRDLAVAVGRYADCDAIYESISIL